jgi:hypothetical protein
MIEGCTNSSACIGPDFCRYGTGGLGTGARPQTADAQGGRGGVGISNSLPWVAAEPPFIQAPVNVSLLRYGLVKPSDNVSRNATMSLLLLREAKVPAGHIDIVSHFWHRPAVNFFGRSWRAMSRSDRIRIFVARIVEMH